MELSWERLLPVYSMGFVADGTWEAKDKKKSKKSPGS